MSSCTIPVFLLFAMAELISSFLCMHWGLSLPLTKTVLPRHPRRFVSPFYPDYNDTADISGQSKEFKEGEAFFFAAQKRMGILLCNSGVVEAQCFFLAGVYLMATFRPIEAWRMFVQALACCRGFDTHGCDEIGHRLQESIYWTCFKSEL